MNASLSIRWLIRRDLPHVLAIEQASFEHAWTEEDFLCCLRQRNCIGMVAADADDRAIGFMLYELHKSRLTLVNFAVSPTHRRQGVGRAMVERLVEKVRTSPRRNEITLEIVERNLEGQLFFRACGFKAVRVLRGIYDDTDEDAYLMRRRLPSKGDEMSLSHPGNRISEYGVKNDPGRP